MTRSGDASNKVLVIGSTKLICDLIANALSQRLPTMVRYWKDSLPVVAASTTIVCEIDSLEFLQTLAHLANTATCVALVREPKHDLLRSLLQAGVRSIVTCHASLDEVRECVGRTSAGRTYLDVEVQRSLSQAYVSGLEDCLTPREQEVAILVAKGYTSRAIATRLKLSLKTVSNHRRNIFRKLGVHDAVSLTHHAVNSGWISVQSSGTEHAAPQPERAAS